MEKKNIAVVAGGFSGESVISLQSAALFMKFIDRTKYNPYLVKILGIDWIVEVNDEEKHINKNRFSFLNEDQEIFFDFALITIHGTPGEDGLLQGYFEMLNIPFSTGDSTVMGLTFDKGYTQLTLKSLGYLTANNILIHENDEINIKEIISKVGLPCFVKPTRSGSSLGISKVKNEDQLKMALQSAFQEHYVAMVEAELTGVEITCGVFTKLNEITALPVTEIVPANEFFDFDAKYYNKGTEEITPARINKIHAEQCQAISKRIYKDLNLKGIVRIDYMLVENDLYIIEVNTVPGMSEASIVPKQLNNAGILFRDFIDSMITLKSTVSA